MPLQCCELAQLEMWGVPRQQHGFDGSGWAAESQAGQAGLMTNIVVLHHYTPQTEL